MRKHSWARAAIPSFFLVFLAAAPLGAQTSVALSLYGAFSGATTGNGVQESPSNSAGGIVELRHITNPLVGWDINYSYNRANQRYTSTVLPPCPTSGCTTAAAVSADAHEVTGDWLVSFHVSSFRPFALAGVGVLFNEPASGQSNTTSSDKPVFVYGAGLDWLLVPHLGLRFQYRGNVDKAADVTTAFSSTGAFTHTAEPMIGAYFSF